MNLDTNITGKLSTKSVKVDENKCACCRRILKSSSEWIRGEKYIIAISGELNPTVEPISKIVDHVQEQGVSRRKR